MAAEILHSSPPPAVAREWRPQVRIPEGVGLGDHEAHDRLATEAAPDGWYVVGTIPISPRDPARLDDPAAWRLRITYWPEVWREVTTLMAQPAVYAAAQMAGLRTRLDQSLQADWAGIQYRRPTGEALCRECFWDGRAAIPEQVRGALSEMESIDRQARTGHMWARPNTRRAHEIADRLTAEDDRRRQSAALAVAEWVRTEYPEILA